MSQARHALSKNTLLLAAAGLLADLSTEMLSPILPVFLTQTLKANGSIVGLVDGVAQAARHIIDGFSGALSDHFRRRRGIALAGFALSALAKPMMGISPVWQAFLGARLLDRCGAGIRSAPRDALVASSVASKNRGEGFGAETFGDNAGAFLGPVLAVTLLYGLQLEMKTLFFVAVAPAALACVTMLLVKEKAATSTKKRVSVSLRQLPRAYWTYLLAVSLFGIGNSSNSFLILRTQELGASLPASILIYAGCNLMAAVVSYPSGFLADKWGRKSILLSSFVVFVISYGGFGLTADAAIAAALFILYGVHQGMFRAVGKALASDLVPEHLRASGVGWYSTTVGLSQLAASLIAGLLWDHIGHQSAFQYGAATAVLGIAAVAALIPWRGGDSARR